MNMPQLQNPYVRLLIMAVLSFISMYILMYAMVNVFAQVYLHINQLYMAALMTTPMVIIELLLMGAMYQKKSVNWFIIAASILLGIASFWFIRQQIAVGDKQFLYSMIPHHSGAILMCREASLQDPEIQELCRSIIANQQEEIDQMEAILERM